MKSDHSGAATRNRPRRPPGPVGQLHDRILIETGTADLATVRAHIDPEISGVWLVSKHAMSRARRLRDEGYDGPLVVDVGSYTRQYASPRAIFTLPEQTNLDEFLDAQIQGAGASVAVTPTRYIGSDDAHTLDVWARQTKELNRTDTVALAPIDVTWLRPHKVHRLRDALVHADHPLAIMLGGQFDPLATFDKALQNLRWIEREVGWVMRARTDLAALDGLAHGAFSGAIGTRPSHRHIVPPGEQPQNYYDNADPAPEVIYPQLMSYVRSERIATAFGSTPHPTCGCMVCGGQSLTRFNGKADRQEAIAHNLRIWMGWLHDLVNPDIEDRMVWWAHRCQLAVLEHGNVNRRLERPFDFTPQGSLQRYADSAEWPPGLATPTATNRE